MQNFIPVNVGPRNFVYLECSKDEQLSTRQFLKKKNTAGGWKLKLISYFTEAIHEPVHLYKLSLVQ
jgi:hypothetical protein